MTLLRRAPFIAVSCLCAAVMAVAAYLVGVTWASRPSFDSGHPDHAAFAERFAEIRRRLASGQEQSEVDLAPLNGGIWQTACLFGGYTQPVARLEALGATVSQADRRRLVEPAGLRLAPVEETEAVIAFVGPDGQAHFIHFAEGLGTEGQHLEACVTKPQTRIVVGPQRRVGVGAIPPPR